MKSGKARALAVTGGKRSDALPNVPAVGELLKGYESTNWYCIVGPANLSRSIVERVHKEMVAALAAPDVRKVLTDGGIDPSPTTPAELAAYLKSETEKWTRVIKAANLKPDQ